MIDRETELSRLLPGAAAAPLPQGSYPFRLSAQCDAPPARVLERVTEVLRAIVREDPEAWPVREDWVARLPRWFVDACRPERTPEQAASDLAAWRTARAAGEADEPAWTLMNFLYWFGPDMRHWWWWSATICETDTFVLVLACDEFDPPHDALLWLLHTAGVVAAHHD